MAIYLYGNRTFATINQNYIDPVKQYAAETFSLSQIDNALTKGWISQQEYDDTIALIPPTENQNVPESEV